MSAVVGQRLGEYEIVGRLGHGGMGAVFKARQISLNRLVAIKVLPPHFAEAPDFITRFKREAMAAAALNHPNIVQVYSAGECDGLHFFAMEFVEGESLHDMIGRKKCVAPREAIAVCLNLAQALDYAWRKAKIVHRDIKPANIFISNDGDVKLGDLGLAKALGNDQMAALTLSNVSIGTPHYASPEQVLADKNIDFRADIYSIGCTLFHALTGRTPYEGDSAMAVMMKHVNEPPPDIRKAWPECPAPLVRLVGKMMKKDRDERQHSYEELIADLNRVDMELEQLEAGAKKEPEDALNKPPSFGAIPGIMAAAVLLIAVLLFWSPWKPRPSVASAPPGGTASSNAAVGISATLPVQSAAATVPVVWKNLIPLIAPRRDAKSGEWKIENGALICAAPSPWALCEIPVDYRGANYDLRFRITRGEGRPIGVFLPFRKGTTGGDLVLDYFNPRSASASGGMKRAGLELMPGRGLDGSDAICSMREQWLIRGRTATVLMQVRDTNMIVSVDGQEILHPAVDWSQLRQGGVDGPLFQPVLGRPIFGVGVFGCEAVFNSIEIQQFDGADKSPATVPAANR